MRSNCRSMPRRSKRGIRSDRSSTQLRLERVAARRRSSSRTSRLLMVSGGTMRSTEGPAATSSRPWSMAAFASAGAVQLLPSRITMPCSRPQPRTPCRCSGKQFTSSWSPSRSCSPRAVTLVSRSRRSISVATVNPARQAKGLPPKVLAWSPGSNTSADAFTSRAPMA